MPIAKVQLPDGRIGRFEVPDGTTPEQVMDFAQKNLVGAPQQPAADNGLPKPGLTDFLTQGATLGFGDEVGAAGSATGAFLKSAGKDVFAGHLPSLGNASTAAGQAYDRSLAEQRQGMAAYQKEHPVISRAAEIIGGLGSAAPEQGAKAIIATAGQAPGLLARIGKGMGIGAGYGAASGFGSGEGGVANRAASAAGGAAGGAIVGGTLPFAASLVSTAARLTKNAFNLGDADKQAGLMLVRAFQEDGFTPAQISQKLQAWQQAGGKGEMLFDLGGDNVKRLARGAASVNGPGTNIAVNALADRQANQAGRVTQDVARSVNPNADFYGTLDALHAQRSAAATPLYQEAFSANRSVASPVLDRILNTPFGESALNTARVRMQNKMTLMGTPDKELMEQAREAGQYIPGGKGVASGLKLQTWDQIKQAMDEEIGALRKGVANGSAKAGDLRDAVSLKNGLVSELDKLDVTGQAGPNSLKPEGGAYARARAAYAGPSQSADAMQMGREIFTQDAEITAKDIGDLSSGDKEFYRAGVARALRDKIANTQDGSNVVRSFFRNQALRDKLRAAFPDQASFNGFKSQMDREAKLFDNARFVSPRTGSQTAMRMEDIGNLSNDVPAGFLEDIATGVPVKKAIISSLTQPVLARAKGLSSSRAESLAQMLFNPDPAAQMRTLQDMSGTAAQLDTRRAINQMLAKRLIAGTGTEIGLSVGRSRR